MVVYYISRQGYQEGPHSLEIIEDKINSNYFTSTDYIYDGVLSEWILLSEFKDTKMFFKNKKNETQISSKQNNQSSKNKVEESQWFLLRGGNQSGPYEYREIISMLQEKLAFEFDYVWAPSLSDWERICECNYFSAEKMKPFLNNSKLNQFRRKEDRISFGASLVAHNNEKLWNGRGFEVSVSGASIEIDHNFIRKGSHLFVHFRPSKLVPAFNAYCEVVSCKNTENSSPKKASCRIGLKFIKINKMSQKVIKQIITYKVA